jgi:hypothetical protein
MRPIGRFRDEEPAARPYNPSGSEARRAWMLTWRTFVPKRPKPFVFVLTQDEADVIAQPAGEGGHQGLHRRLQEQLEHGLTISLDDAQLGELIRYMTQYKSGGFQGRLRTAFERSLRKQLGF